MEKDLARINKMYPWYYGLTTDLIFGVAISSVWLANVKGFDAAQITFLSTISGLAAVLLQLPILWIIKRIGVTKSVRVSAICVLISSIMMAFCTTYFGFVMQNIVFVISMLFGAMGSVLIKNNLDYQYKGSEYVKIASKGSTIYSVATMLTTLTIGVLFSWWQYLPMILGIITCVIALVLSFMIYDVEEKNETAKTPRSEGAAPGFLLPRPIKAFMLLVLFYGLVYGMIMIAQPDGKLFIQYKLDTMFGVDIVATIMGVVLFGSRVMRLLAVLIYPKIYAKLKDRVVILIPLMLLLAFGLMLAGYTLEIDFYLKIVLMGLGFSILPSMRDPLKIYAQNLVLQKFAKKYQKDILMYLATARQMGAFLFGSVASAVLLNFSLEYVYLLFAVMIVPIVYIGVKLKSIVRRVDAGAELARAEIEIGPEN